MGRRPQRRATAAINQQRRPPPFGAPGRDRGPRGRGTLASAAGRRSGAQQQPFFLPDLVLTFLLLFLLVFSVLSFLDFLDFLVATASVAASTAASTMGAAAPRARRRPSPAAAPRESCRPTSLGGGPVL